ncbi:MAG: glycosyltransferase [Alphaproteobacteria bacterium]|nr:glycosyltransferase [Alphaproteobacteria bacterium]
MSSASVVIVSYHTGWVLYAAIASALQQEGLANIVVVDNGNPPDVIAKLQQQALMEPRLVIVSGHGNIGFAAACNLGSERATGEYLLLLNPDCLLPPDALATLMREMSALPNTMLAGVHLVNPDGSEQRGGRRALLTPGSALGEMLGLRKLNFNRTPMPQGTHDVQAISGACMCIRKADYDVLGGMDEKFFLHVEDLDLCMRVARAGKRIVCVPMVKVAHLLSTSGETGRGKIEWHKAKSFIYYFEKHFADSMLPGVLQILGGGIWLRYFLRRYFGAQKTGNVIARRKLRVLAGSLTTRQHAGSLAGKTILVTGATSQVGVEVVRHLLAAGIAVLAVSRHAPLPFYHPLLKWLQKDLTAADFSLDGYLADAAIHCAPQWHLAKVVPVLAASEIKRIVAIGSTSVFSKARSRNGIEKDIVDKHTRAEQEIPRVCGELGIAWTILRPTMIYGIGIDKNITSLARFIRKFGFVPVYPPAVGRRQPVHAEDIAIGALQAMHSASAADKMYNLSGGEILTYREMILRLFAVMKISPKIVGTTLLPSILGLAGLLLRKPLMNRDVAYRMNEDMVFFHDDAERDFGYHPREFLSGGIADLGEG